MSIAVRGRTAENGGGSVKKKKKSDEISLVRKKSLCKDQQQPSDQRGGPFRSCLQLYRKPLAVNALCLGFLLFYSLFGGFVFLHFEEPNWKMSRERDMADRLQCVKGAISAAKSAANAETGGGGGAEGMLAERIVVRCVLSQGRDERMEWNLKCQQQNALRNAVLFGFGILTTLGYGKIEPQTTEGRLFTVFYGFLGVPFTVIIFTNFGRYLQRLERCVRKRLCRQWRRIATWRRRTIGGTKVVVPPAAADEHRRKGSWILPPITVLDEDGHNGGGGDLRTQKGRHEIGGNNDTMERTAKLYTETAYEDDDDQFEEEEEAEEDEAEDQISPLTLIFIVFLYLLLGAMLIDWLDTSVDFPNGIYFAFLCLTAIEYGKLIPADALYLPLVIGYICFGLAISTIALDIGSTYVKKLYYVGRKIRNIASIKIWFGAKHLRVRELLAALGHNIGLEPSVLCDLDLEQLISSAIQVKEGRLHRVPQTHMIMDGIWPPELVPLFLKEGTFPEWVDADERRKWSVASVMVRRRSIRRGSTGPTASAALAQQQPLRKQSSSTSRSARSAAAAATLLLSQPPERTPPPPPVQPDRLSVVRFEEFVRTDEEGDGDWPEEVQRRKCYYYPPMLTTDETEPDSTTSGINSGSDSPFLSGTDALFLTDPDLSFVDTALPSSSCWSLSVPSSGGTTAQHLAAAATQMRRSETMPPAVGHLPLDTSPFALCTFPSMEMPAGAARRPPLPPLAPLPPFTEEEEEERQEDDDDDFLGGRHG